MYDIIKKIGFDFPINYIPNIATSNKDIIIYNVTQIMMYTIIYN